ncbi:MAG TPA: CAP domain-containing protein [Hyphomicrobiales bacterium]|nr:CAP domain-containing protein [Hyphomicrobiales bacterium]
MTSDRRRPFAAHLRLIQASLTAAALAGCAMLGGPPLYPVPRDAAYFRDLATPGAAVDPAVAARLISGYRAANRLGPVAADPTLTAIAKREAAAEAARGSVAHDLAGPLPGRADAAGYDYAVIEENVAGGYDTLAAAFDGWQRSPEHRANMLAGAVTRIGIAAAQANGKRYRVYWSLVLAAPASRRHCEEAKPTKQSRAAGAGACGSRIASLRSQ